MRGWGGIALLAVLTLVAVLVAAVLTLTAAFDADGLPRPPLGVPEAWSWSLLQVLAPLAVLLALLLLGVTVTLGVLRGYRGSNGSG